MLAVAWPVLFVPQASEYRHLLAIAFVLGVAGSSFAVGVSYVSRWAPADRQGSALGIYRPG
jgi:NNP family nitrate/nitrite transporter-like MFS transporter